MPDGSGGFLTGIIVLMIKQPRFNLLQMLLFFFLAGILGISPDFDAIKSTIEKKDAAGHKSWTHYPLLFLILQISILCLLGIILTLFSLSNWALIFWSLMWVSPISLFWQYVHDSIGSSLEGVEWSPFSTKSYRLRLKWPFFYETRESPMPEDEWIRKYFLKPNPELILGLLISFVVVSLTIIYITSFI